MPEPEATEFLDDFADCDFSGTTLFIGFLTTSANELPSFFVLVSFLFMNQDAPGCRVVLGARGGCTREGALRGDAARAGCGLAVLLACTQI